ncbi:hypothetical protein [Methanobacterium subterraneum]|jgi:hypothetical protein|uniref:Uncharacterized protein n=1 Tax=Methanobacterium subterraneum TaxID=59277 RepID=A0A2H4VN10_9EURY|nr:hypothetical protein [Methanobacterium subterraneum]MBW4257148.1 hypothetical protein [Methanobacterium sp. YSL]PKL71634.1 MAG: hypothetical protein CVV29_09600 [Methanobacteriales archaeon HGW-Methanobacteriales-2]AUB56648.1 hypothetical protein BK007_11960 [Methanobacterium subterraneum]AUB59478.1 hypothetical protein BK009_01525 [Methanobacterium subterraneum]NMO09922.1 hypothetical protein [Methanobacterium subterraneum]
MILEAILYASSGFFMKFSDDALDTENNTLLGVISGLICVAGIGYLSVNFPDAATIFLAILMGTLFSGKVDKLGHIVTLVIFLAILVIFGLPSIGLGALIICTLAAWVDEVGNDRESLKGKKIVETFFNYRFTMKIVVLALALLGAFYPVQFQGFQPVTFIYFILFDLSYELAGLKFNRIYDGIKGIYGVIV